MVQDVGYTLAGFDVVPMGLQAGLQLEAGTTDNAKRASALMHGDSANASKAERLATAIATYANRSVASNRSAEAPDARTLLNRMFVAFHAMGAVRLAGEPNATRKKGNARRHRPRGAVDAVLAAGPSPNDAT